MKALHKGSSRTSLAILHGLGLAAWLIPAASLGLLGCGSPEDPPPFASEDSLATRLERDLAAPVHVDLAPRHPYVTATTQARVLATGNERGDALRTWIVPYAKDLGLDSNDLEVSAEGADVAGIHHVQIRTKGRFGSLVRTDGIDVMTDATGHFLALSGELMPAGMAAGATVSAEEASLAALTAFPGESDAPNKVLSTTLGVIGMDGTASSADAKLTYTVKTEARIVLVDAANGKVLLAQPQEEGVAAYSVQSLMFDESRAFFVENKKLEVETSTIDGKDGLLGVASGSRIDVASFVGYRANIPQHSTILTTDDPTRWDETTPTYQGSYVKDQKRIPLPLSASGIAPRVAVDAMANITLADRFFRKHFGRGPITRNDPGFGDRIQVVVHANFGPPTPTKDESGEFGQDRRNDAYYHRLTKSIYLGDGSYFFSEANRTAKPFGPLALSFDVIGHELAHAFFDDGFGLIGEPGAISEGVADVVGTIFEREADPGARSDSIGDRSCPGVCIRNLAHPERRARYDSFGTANHLANRGCVEQHGNTEIAAVPTERNDFGCRHMNATIVGHAWHLMSYGGYNTMSRVVVEAPLTEEASTLIGLRTAAMAANPVLARIVPRTFVSLARDQLGYARMAFPDQAKTVACAWHAVGALDDAYLAKLGYSCTVLNFDSCAGRPNGWYCSAVQPFDAIQCTNGSVTLGAQCQSGYVCAIRDNRSRSAVMADFVPRCDSFDTP